MGHQKNLQPYHDSSPTSLQGPYSVQNTSASEPKITNQVNGQFVNLGFLSRNNWTGPSDLYGNKQPQLRQNGIHDYFFASGNIKKWKYESNMSG